MAIIPHSLDRPERLKKTLDNRSVIDKNTGCKIWYGTRNLKGYGNFMLGGSKILVHRLVWILYKGDIPPDHDVCHTCDNPSCINIDHLFVGTRKDNMHDASIKGRMSGNSDSSYMFNASIRERIKNESGSATFLATKYKCSPTTIYRIRAGTNQKTKPET